MDLQHPSVQLGSDTHVSNDAHSSTPTPVDMPMQPQPFVQSIPVQGRQTTPNPTTDALGVSSEISTVVATARSLSTKDSSLTTGSSGRCLPFAQTLLSQKQGQNASSLSDAGSTPTLPSLQTPNLLTVAAGGSSLEQKRCIAVPAPGDDEPIGDTVLLFHCCRLLDKACDDPTPLPLPLPLSGLLPSIYGNSQEEWIQYMESNPLEKRHLYSVITQMANKFVAEPTRDPDSIREVILISPLLNKGHYLDLVGIFIQEFQRDTSLDVNILLGVVQLVRDSPPDFLAFDNLTLILRPIWKRLEETPKKNREDIIHLTAAVTVLFTALGTCLPKDEIRVEFGPLFRILSTQQRHKDPLVKFQARLAMQTLVSVSGRQTAGTNLDQLLRKTLRTNSPKQWFQDVQRAKGFVRHRLLTDLHKLIYKGPSSDNTNFQWHVCQILGELAVDPTCNINARHQAITLLQEYTKTSARVKSGYVIRSWALTILRHISELSVSFIADGFHDPLAIYNEAIMERTTSLTCGLRVRNVKPFEFAQPLLGSLPLPISSPLLHMVNTDPDVEFAIDRLLRQRSRAYDRRAVYIQLLSKQNLQASEEVLVELQERTSNFLGSKSEVLLVLGDSGAGKSTFGLRLEAELWAGYKPGGRIPLFIDLKTVDAPDKDMVRQHLEDLGFFTDLQIESMRGSRQFILVCDGYDECHKWTNLHTKNQFNKHRQWQAKMIISCRTQYLGPNYRNYFEPETATIDNPNFSHTSNLYEEAVIVPFRMSQIREYVERFTQVPKASDYLGKEAEWTTEQYMERLKNITHLMELAKNPFMLKMILDVLPRIAGTTTKMTRVDLYDRFVELHFESEKQRLINQHSNGKMDNGILSVFLSLENDDIEHLGRDFSKQLSYCLFKEQEGLNSVTYSAVFDSGSWKDAFFGPDFRTKLLRQSAQLVCRENFLEPLRLIRHSVRPSRKRNLYEFSHRSLLEYFYSCLIFDPRGNVSQLDLATCLDSSDSPLPIVKHPLGQIRIVSESSIVHFLAERVHQSREFSTQLQNILRLSKAEAAVSQAAANAVTILIRASERFNGADLSGIRVPGADLSYGDFDLAQLQGADLRNTTLRNVWLRHADLSDSQMEGIKFGQWPYILQKTIAWCCRFSPDGKQLAVGLESGSIAMYDTSTWSETYLHGHTGTVKDIETDGRGAITMSYSNAVTSFAYSHSGKQMVTGSKDMTVRLWDVQTGALIFTLSGHTDDVLSVAISPNGQQIASGSDDSTVRLWDTETGALCSTLSSHTSCVRSVGYSPSGQQIVSGSEDNTVRLWDAQTGSLCSTLHGHNSHVLSVTYSPNGLQIASGSMDHTIRLWDAQTGALTSILRGHSDYVTAVTYSSNGRQLASGSADQTVKLWDVQTGTLTSTFSGHIDSIVSVAYSPNDQQIASSSYGTVVRLWDVHTDDITFNGHTRDVTSLAFSPSGQQVASGSQDSTVRLWDVQTGALTATLSGHTSLVFSVVYSPSGQQIASGSQDNTVRLWDVRTGTISSTLSGHTSYIFSVAYSPCGRQIASGSKDKTVRLWDVQTGALTSILSGHTGVVYSVAYSPSGEQLASSSKDRTVRLWDVQTGALRFTLSGHAHSVPSVVFSPSGQHVASSSYDRTIRLWDARTGDHSTTLRGHTAYVSSLAFSPCGLRMASGGYDKTLRLWDVDTGQCLFVLGGFQDGVTSISWKIVLDDTYLAVGGWDKSVRLWKVVQDAEGVQFRLQWRSAPDTLVLSKANIQGVKGLTETNKRLFEQQQ
ncbi:protein HIRA/HIR1 [Entomortierella parvispora]|uniref:Protein HIRA/HIR1 n=1 Tax=Entomortierella parvispora TaxID=205924 RepID=A0A9P3HE93_9FUNG|nr:protein HIRA/HIR1 [Entomortierella parvispora]